jgi:hypothetical protein
MTNYSEETQQTQKEKKVKQAGAELCLQFKIFLSLKIVSEHFDKLSLSSNFSKLIQVVFQ